MRNYRCLPIAGMAAILSLAFAQDAAQVPGAPPVQYLLGVEDVISIHATDAEDISDKAIRIGPNGFINLSTIGSVKAAGLTTEQLQKEIADRLKPFIRRPEVEVNVIEVHSQPVSVIGAVMAPGTHQLQGNKRLVEILSLAGGLRQDAGSMIKIVRLKEWGLIPLPGAAMDSSGGFSVAEVNVQEIMEARNPALNIQIMPQDVISVPRAEMVYVIGEVKRAGEFVLSEKSRMSVLQAISMAAGLSPTAKAPKARLLRANSANLTRTEVPVDVQKILDGKSQDLPMQPNDILFVPSNRTKSAAIKVIEAMIQAGTGIAVYRGGSL